jgi:hypothetical protein
VCGMQRSGPKRIVFLPLMVSLIGLVGLVGVKLGFNRNSASDAFAACGVIFAFLWGLTLAIYAGINQSVEANYDQARGLCTVMMAIMAALFVATCVTFGHSSLWLSVPLASIAGAEATTFMWLRNYKVERIG